MKETKWPLELVRLLPKGRKKVELLIITQMPPFRTSWLYLVSPFHAAKIGILRRITKHSANFLKRFQSPILYEGPAIDRYHSL